MVVDTLTKRYARALYAEAAEHAEQSAVHAQLQAVAEALRADTRFLDALKHPTLPIEDKVAMLLRIAGADQRPTASFKLFLRLVLTKGRAHVLEAAADGFLELWDEALNLVRAEAVSAFPLSEREQTELKQALANLTNCSIELDLTVDPSLVGGMTVRIGDRLIEGSVRGKLKKLSEGLQGY